LTSSQGKLITKETVKRLRKLLFGSSRGSFNDEWTGQNFVFTSVPGLEYGLVQHKVMDTCSMLKFPAIVLVCTICPPLNHLCNLFLLLKFNLLSHIPVWPFFLLHHSGVAKGGPGWAHAHPTSKNSSAHSLLLWCIRDKQGIISKRDILATKQASSAWKVGLDLV